MSAQASVTEVSGCATFNTAALLLFLALVGALYPLYTPPTNPYLRYGNVFAAGFLLTAALVHLLPEGDSELRHLMEYPISGVFTVLGAGGMFVVDFYLQGKLKSGSTEQQSGATSYILAVALSLHSAVEGVALGAASSNSDRFTAFYIAVLAHKFFEAITLGTDLAHAVREGGSKAGAVIAAVIYASLTPLGIGVGRWFMGGGVWDGALNCISAGIFLYVALGELLMEEVEEGWGDDGATKAGVFVGSCFCMCLLGVWA